MKNIQHPLLFAAVVASFVTMLVLWPNYGAVIPPLLAVAKSGTTLPVQASALA
ncbi:hypothetical protein D3C71_1610220 [compost metagenome]